MTNPIISVCMITYDRPELLEEAIYCFLQQTYPHKELIILNDRAAWDAIQ